MVIMLMVILFTGTLLKKLNQPYFVTYIVAGILIGPYCFGVFDDAPTISAIGEMGLLLQMFFLGTKKEVRTIVSNFKKPFIGVMVQLGISFLFVWILGASQSWHPSEIILFSFILSVSSSAIIHEYLEKSDELVSPLGLLTSGVLVLQDFLLAPMLLVINFLGRKELPLSKIPVLLLATILISFFLRRVLLNQQLQFRFPNWLKHDHEAQLFLGLVICFGFAWVSEQVNLSAALGAMLGGMLISKSDALQWFEKNLIPFRIFFISLFFISIGLQINVNFFISHFPLIALVVLIVILVNSAINAFAFRLMQVNWRDSIYAGALLSQIGEFSLVFCIVAKDQNLVGAYWYQLTLAVIAGSMLISAIWINIIRTFIYMQPSHVRLYGLKIKKFLRIV